jgi:hypothetical protein
MLKVNTPTLMGKFTFMHQNLRQETHWRQDNSWPTQSNAEVRERNLAIAQLTAH